MIPIDIDLETGIRTPAISINLRRPERALSVCLSLEEAASLAVQLTGTLIGQAVNAATASPGNARSTA